MNIIEDNTKTWGIVELMGHKVVAGQVSKSEMLGKALLRVDVPATSSYPEFTQFYGEASIYCVTFVSEEVARLTAEANKTNPVSVYVPNLITQEQLEKKVEIYQEQIKRLQETRGLPAPRATIGTCTWQASNQEDSNAWSTSCGHEWQFETGDPEDNNVQYCPFCGRSVRIFEPADQEEDQGDEPEF